MNIYASFYHVVYLWRRYRAFKITTRPLDNTRATEQAIRMKRVTIIFLTISAGILKNYTNIYK